VRVAQTHMARGPKARPDSKSELPEKLQLAH